MMIDKLIAKRDTIQLVIGYCQTILIEFENCQQVDKRTTNTRNKIRIEFVVKKYGVNFFHEIA